MPPGLSPLVLGNKRLGPGQPCYVIAEAGVNHNGDPALARALVDAAADAGADAVKFQTFDPAALASVAAPKAEYQARAEGPGNQREMLERLTLSEPLHRELHARAAARGIAFLSTPFEERSADFLETLGVPAFKIASGEVTNHPFLAHVARKGRPMLVSTGMCTLAEVEAAVRVIREAASPPLALLHCVSAYPAPAEDSNLRAMATLRSAFQVPVGWSDHTAGIDVAIAAVALGADVIEKHLTMDRRLPGPDHQASLEPNEVADLVRAVRRVTSAIGTGLKVPAESERSTAAIARKSLHWRRNMRPGERVGADDLLALRPGTGISPSEVHRIVGRQLRGAVEAMALVRDSDLEPV